ncbi:MAG: Hsp20 family protein [Pseudomonadota bacterium]
MSDVAIHRVPKSEDRTLPVFREMEDLLQRIRSRAFDIFAGRARHAEGNALADWLAAERELCGAAGELVEHDKEFVLGLALAGFSADEVAVTATPRELIVRARSSSETTEEPATKGGKVRWSEFRSNDVYRSVALPADIDVEKVTATFKNGLLKVVAAKTSVPAQVAVKVEALAEPERKVAMPMKVSPAAGRPKEGAPTHHSA